MITVMIADDHPVVLEGIRRALETEPDISVVAVAKDGRQAVELCRGAKPDVAVVDLAMPVMDGLAVTHELARCCPQTRIIILTMYENEEYALRLLRGGASGFITKGTSAKELPQAIRKVHAGETYLSQSILEKIGSRMRVPDEADPIRKLSDRELQVLRALAEGKKAPEIAQALELSVSTVHGYRYRLMRKLGIDNIAALIRLALDKGIVR